MRKIYRMRQKTPFHQRRHHSFTLGKGTEWKQERCSLLVLLQLNIIICDTYHERISEYEEGKGEGERERKELFQESEGMIMIKGCFLLDLLVAFLSKKSISLFVCPVCSKSISYSLMASELIVLLNTDETRLMIMVTSTSTKTRKS